jgi:HK97 gp10 family phage protein
MDSQLKVRNLDRLNKKLLKSPIQVQQALSEAAEANAKSFAMKAKRQAESNRRTGELDDTITAYPAQGMRGFVWRVKAGIKESAGFYARFLEFGTRNMQAQPFFFTTYRANRRAFRARTGRLLKKAMQRIKTNG